MEFHRFYSLRPQKASFSTESKVVLLLKRKESDELGAVSHGQTTFWYNGLTWPGQPPRGKASSQAACGLFLGMGCASSLH